MAIVLRKMWVTLALFGLIAGGTSCAHSKPDKQAAATPVKESAAADLSASGGAPALPAAPTAADYEQALRRTVAEQARQTNARADQAPQITYRKPYFYKEYAVYPESGEDASVVVQETQKRSAPYVADVTLAKQRFATRLHRKRMDAEADANFLRDTGTETLTFELRNGQWARTGSLFVATVSEERVNGEWTPVQETAIRTAAPEEERQSFVGRAWKALTGR